MTDWFRSWHGAPTDPKWRTVAKRANVTPALVVSVAWVLLDRASQADSRGSIDGTDIETVADFLGCEADEVERIISAMHDKAVLDSDRFTAWERRQPKREREDETAAERKAAERARKAAKNGSEGGGTPAVTPRHTTSHQVTPREEERRVEEKDTSSLRSEGAAKAVAAQPVDPDAELFRRGREVLGKGAGGLISNLKAHHGGIIQRARADIERASVADRPSEYIGKILANAARGSPQRGRYTGPTIAEMAGVESIHDLFPSNPDGPRDHRSNEYRSDAADPRVPGFAGRVREPDRDDARRNVVDLQRSGAAWR